MCSVIIGEVWFVIWRWSNQSHSDFVRWNNCDYRFIVVLRMTCSHSPVPFVVDQVSREAYELQNIVLTDIGCHSECSWRVSKKSVMFSSNLAHKSFRTDTSNHKCLIQGTEKMKDNCHQEFIWRKLCFIVFCCLLLTFIGLAINVLFFLKRRVC